MLTAKKSGLSELERVEQNPYLITLDYPYRPRRRALDRSRSKILGVLRAGANRYADLLEKFAAFNVDFENIAVHRTSADSLCPHWSNGRLPAIDAMSLYGFLALNNPRLYVEIGSGQSTMFARQAIKDHGLRTSIVSIDPFADANINTISDKVIRRPCEEISSDFFDDLSCGDLLFIDNSHRSFSNSDVTVFFTEILPALPSGVVYGLQDIFLPEDYPEEWKDRFYNEQYLLVSYLLGGADGDEIMLPNAFVSYFAPYLLGPLRAVLNDSRLTGIEKTGGAFWMRRA